mgnify:FL=1
MKNNPSLMIIDPAVVTPSIESFNRISTVAPFNVTYHLPALYGTETILKTYNKNTLGVIVLGSATSVNDKNIWQDEIGKVLLNAAEMNIPILGLCYGHQLIGKIFGGKVGPLWHGKIKRGNRKVDIKKSAMWGNADSGELLYSHQDGVIKTPPNFDILASSEMVDIEAIQSKNKPIWGFQAHLEATEAFVKEHNLDHESAKQCFTFGHKLLDTFIMSLK